MASCGAMKSGWRSWGSSSSWMVGSGRGLGRGLGGGVLAVGFWVVGFWVERVGSSWLEFQTWSEASAIWLMERPVTEELGRSSVMARSPVVRSYLSCSLMRSHCGFSLAEALPW